MKSAPGGGQVSGSAFLKYYSIPHTETRSFPAVWENGLLIISLTP